MMLDAVEPTAATRTWPLFFSMTTTRPSGKNANPTGKFTNGSPTTCCRTKPLGMF
jgi:hypothetical protein